MGPPGHPVAQKPHLGGTTDAVDAAVPSSAAVDTQSVPTGSGPPQQQPVGQGHPPTSGSRPSHPTPSACATKGAEAPEIPGRDDRTTEQRSPQSASEAPTEDIARALHDAFNRPGQTGISDDRPRSGSVSNPAERRKRTRASYVARKAREPAAAQRVTERIVDVWDPKNKAIRDFLYEEYAGRCQICGETNRFPRRDGRAYFEAVYLIPHTQAAWTDDPGSVICLCALCSAKFQHGAVKAQNVAAQIRSQKAIAEGGDGTPVVNIELVGKQVTITFSERHLIEVQEMLAVAEGQHHTNTANDRLPQAAHPSQLPHAASTSSRSLVQQGSPSTSELVRCPHCHPKAGLVRRDNLERHMARAHKRSQANHGSYSSPQKPAENVAGVRRCRACGSPVVPGEDYCYSHM